MTPPPILAEEISTDELLSHRSLVGSLATGTEFRPASIFCWDTGLVLSAPLQLQALRLGRVSSELAEPSSSQMLFAPDVSMSIPPSESTESAAEVAQWIAPVVQRLVELRDLPANWDHHGAPPVTLGDLASALQFLSRVMLPATPPPAVVPVSGGGIQLEWHRAGLDVELLIGDGTDGDLYFCEIESGREWEGRAAPGFAELGLAERLID